MRDIFVCVHVCKSVWVACTCAVLACKFVRLVQSCRVFVALVALAWKAEELAMPGVVVAAGCVPYGITQHGVGTHVVEFPFAIAWEFPFAIACGKA